MGARLSVRVRIYINNGSCKCRHYNKSTRPWVLDNTATTELCMSRGPPRAHATISPPWNAWSIPSKRSRLTVASPTAVSGETRPFDSAVACIKERIWISVQLNIKPSFVYTHARSKRVWAARAASAVPTPTMTLFAKRVTSAVSFDMGGPASLEMKLR